MITPRRTRLVRVPDLQAFRAAIVQLADPESRSPESRHSDCGADARAPLRQLARSLPAPMCVTRDELYAALHARLADAAAPIDRDRTGRARASRRARVVASARRRTVVPGPARTGARNPSLLRSTAAAGSAGGALRGTHPRRAWSRRDRPGADRMRPADAVSRRRRSRVRASRPRVAARCDEHMLRERLIADVAAEPGSPDHRHGRGLDCGCRRVVRRRFRTARPHAGTGNLDLVATEGVLGSGFHERLHKWWPGIEEIRMPASTEQRRCCSRRRTRRPTNRGGRFAIARRNWPRVASQRPSESVAVVFKRPLPYLYVAPRIFADAGLAVQTSAALPLAAEPTAAALDLVLEAVATRFTAALSWRCCDRRISRSRTAPTAVTRETVSALDRALSEARYLGDPEALAALADDWRSDRSRQALQIGLTITQELAPLGERRHASEQLATLAGVLVCASPAAG